VYVNQQKKTTLAPKKQNIKPRDKNPSQTTQNGLKKTLKTTYKLHPKSLPTEPETLKSDVKIVEIIESYFLDRAKRQWEEHQV